MVKAITAKSAQFLPPKHVRNLAVWAVLGQLAPLTAAPFLSRLYSPADFGALATFVATTSVLLVVATGRLEVGVTTATSEVESVSIARTARTLVLAVSLAIGLIAAVMTIAETGIFGLSSSVMFLWVPASLIGGWLVIDRSILLHAESFGRMGARSVAAPAGQALQQFAWVVRGASQFGLIAGWAFGSILALFIPKRQGWVGLASPAEAWGGLRRWRRYPITLVPAGLLSQVSQYLAVFVLGAIYGDAVLGQFSLVMRVLSIPASLVAFAAGQYFFARASRMHREGIGDVGALLTSAVKSLLLLGAFPVLLVSTTAPFWFPWVFGSQWQEAGVYGLLMAPSLAVQIVVTPVGTLLVSLGHNASQLTWDIIRCIGLMACGIACVTLGLSPLEAVAALSLVNTLVYLDGLRRVYRAAGIASRDFASREGGEPPNSVGDH